MADGPKSSKGIIQSSAESVGEIVDRIQGAPTDKDLAGLTPHQIESYRKKARRVGTLSVVLKIGIMALAIVALINGEMVWVITGLFTLVFTFFPMILRRNYHITIPWILEFMIFLALFLHFAGGVLHLYGTFENWDTMTHLVSTFMLAVVSVTMIYLIHTYWPGLTLDIRAIMLFTVFVAAFLGAFWEIMEWSVDKIFGTQEQHGLDDTMKDLVMDMAGAMIAAMLGAKWIVDGTMRGMTADFGDALNERVFERIEPFSSEKIMHEEK